MKKLLHMWTHIHLDLKRRKTQNKLFDTLAPWCNHQKLNLWKCQHDLFGKWHHDHFRTTKGGYSWNDNTSSPQNVNMVTLTWFLHNNISVSPLFIATISVLSIVEFPAESRGDVLHGRSEQRGGDVQQRISWSSAGGVPSFAGGEGST